MREKTKFQISIGCSESQEKSDIHFGDSMKIEKLSVKNISLKRDNI